MNTEVDFPIQQHFRMLSQNILCLLPKEEQRDFLKNILISIEFPLLFLFEKGHTIFYLNIVKSFIDFHLTET